MPPFRNLPLTVDEDRIITLYGSGAMLYGLSEQGTVYVARYAHDGSAYWHLHIPKLEATPNVNRTRSN